MERAGFEIVVIEDVGIIASQWEARVDTKAINCLQIKFFSSLHSSLYCRSNGTETSYGTTSKESAK
jgi:hypothetical protein